MRSSFVSAAVLAASVVGVRSIDCTANLVVLQTGQSDTCGGGNAHYFPVDMALSDCHGWSATDPTGRVHYNSANNMQCNADGSFSFAQYAGNLNCQGSGVTKTYFQDECAQDTPPVLWTKATNLNCCSDPTGPDCMFGTPSVSVPNSMIYLNGEVCDGDDGGNTAGGNPNGGLGGGNTNDFGGGNNDDGNANGGFGGASNTNTGGRGGGRGGNFGGFSSNTNTGGFDGNSNAEGGRGGGNTNTGRRGGNFGGFSSNTNTGGFDGNTGGNTGGSRTEVTWTTYTDAACTQLPSFGGNPVVTVDSSLPCNTIPNGAVGPVECHADHVVLQIHPGQSTCDGDVEFTPPPQTLQVGVCQHFPGPVDTWKYIDPATYTCGGSASATGGSTGSSDIGNVSNQSGGFGGGNGNTNTGGFSGIVNTNTGVTAGSVNTNTRPNRSTSRGGRFGRRGF